jgi:hypothetical protein
MFGCDLPRNAEEDEREKCRSGGRKGEKVEDAKAKNFFTFSVFFFSFIMHDDSRERGEFLLIKIFQSSECRWVSICSLRLCLRYA